MSIRSTAFNTRLGSNGKTAPGAYRSQCKLCPHAIYHGQEAVWLTRPMGLSHTPCAEKHAARLATEAAA